MTSKLSTATLTLATDLSSDDYGHNDATLYRVSPGKGARVSGVLEVYASYREHTTRGRNDVLIARETLPTLTLTTPHVRTAYGKPDPEPLEPLTINGRETSRTWADTFNWVPQRLDARAYDATHWETGEPLNYRSTLLGEPGVWTPSPVGYNSLTDAAREAVKRLANTVAQEYMTDAVAAAALVRAAEYPIDGARRDLEAARKALDDAERELADVMARVSGFLA